MTPVPEGTCSSNTHRHRKNSGCLGQGKRDGELRCGGHRVPVPEDEKALQTGSGGD